MGKKASKRQRTQQEEDSSSDWIAALAKKSATSEAAAAHVVPSKAQRIEKRNAKKRRRQERKPASFNNKNAASIQNTNGNNEQEYEKSGKRMNRRSEASLHNLARELEHRVSSLRQGTSSLSSSSRNSTRLYQKQVVKKGKATAGNRLTDGMVQPRRRDYGGLGLARPTIYIELRDPSFVPKLEEEFGEHVPGFFGKQKTKAMKKQLDGNMLWRQLAEKRANDVKLGGKKLSEMSPDERVEAMIKAGMI